MSPFEKLNAECARLELRDANATKAKKQAEALLRYVTNQLGGFRNEVTEQCRNIITTLSEGEKNNGH